MVLFINQKTIFCSPINYDIPYPLDKKLLSFNGRSRVMASRRIEFDSLEAALK